MSGQKQHKWILTCICIKRQWFRCLYCKSLTNSCNLCDWFFLMSWSKTICTFWPGGLCAQRDGGRPSAGGGAHGAGDPACQCAAKPDCEEQQSGAHTLQHSPALPSYHPCQQEEQAAHRYLKPPSCLSLCAMEPPVNAWHDWKHIFLKWSEVETSYKREVEHLA